MTQAVHQPLHGSRSADLWRAWGLRFGAILLAMLLLLLLFVRSQHENGKQQLQAQVLSAQANALRQVGAGLELILDAEVTLMHSLTLERVGLNQAMVGSAPVPASAVPDRAGMQKTMRMAMRLHPQISSLRWHDAQGYSQLKLVWRNGQPSAVPDVTQPSDALSYLSLAQSQRLGDEVVHVGRIYRSNQSAHQLESWQSDLLSAHWNAQGEIDALFSATIDLTPMVKAALELARPEISLALLDEVGLIWHADEREPWTFGVNLAQAKPALWQAMQGASHGQLTLDEQIWTWHVVPMRSVNQGTQQAQKVYVLSAVAQNSASQIRALAALQKKLLFEGLIGWLLLGCVIAGAVAVWVRRKVMSQADLIRVQQLMQVLPIALLVRQASGAVVYANPLAKALLDAGFLEALDAASQAHDAVADEFVWRKPGGAAQVYSVQRSPVSWNGVDCTVLTFDDATSHHSILEQHAKLAQALSTSHLLAVYSADFCVQQANDLFCALYELPLEKLIGVDLRTLRGREISSSMKLNDILSELLQNKTVQQLVSRINLVGKLQRIEALYVPIMDAEGQLQSIHFLGKDVSELEQTRHDLHVHDSRFQSYLDISANAYVVLDEAGMILSCNARLCALTGHDREALLGLSLFDLSPEIDPIQTRTHWQSLQAGEDLSLNQNMRHVDGHNFPVQGLMRCAVLDGQRLFIGELKDMSQERLAAQLLAVQQKAIDTALLMLELDSDGRYVRANVNWLSRFYPDESKAHGCVLMQHCPPALLTDARLDGSVSAQMKLADTHQQPIWLNSMAYRLQDETGLHSRIMILSQELTDVVKLEQSLNESEARFLAFVKSMGVGFWQFDDKGSLLDANVTLCNLIGYTHGEMAGMQVSKIDKGPQLKELIKKAGLGNKVPQASHFFDTVIRSKKGSLIPVAVGVVAIELAGKLEFLSSVRDIREARLDKRGFMQLRAAIDNTNLVLELTADGLFKSANLPFLKCFGFTSAELKLKSVPGFELNHMMRLLGGVQTGSPLVIPNWEQEYQSANQESIWLRSTASPVYDEVGKLQSVIIMSFDITSFVMARRAIEREKLLARSFLEFSPIGLFVHDAYGNFIETNRVFCDMLGLSREDLLHMSILDVEVGVNAEAMATMWNDMQSLQNSYNHTGSAQRQDGSVFEWAITLTIVDMEGERAYIGSARDMTAETKTEELLQRQQLVLDSSHLTVHVNADWHVVDANLKFLKRFGLQLSEVLGLSWFVVGETKEDEHLEAEITRLKVGDLNGGQTVQLEIQRLTKTGQVVWLLATYYPVFNEEGQIDSVTIMALDITNEKQSEAHLRESHKLEAIGQLTGGLAHDFNNMLGIVVGNLDLMEADLPQENALLIEHFNAARQAAMRGTSVAHSLLSVARRQRMDLTLTDINAVLSNLVGLLMNSVGTRMQFRSHLCAQGLWATLDSSGLSNVVLNLVINARDALQDQAGLKVIDLATEQMHIGSDDPSGLTSGDYAMISVKDNGPGMSDEVRERAFDPFFTTKEAGKGTGLGLAMVRGYAEQLGGLTRILTQLGAGTTVQILLPLASAPTQRQNQAEAVRLGALKALNVLDTAPDAEMDALVQEAAALLEVPTALVSLVDSDRQWFKAKVGLAADETPRSMAFCAHAIQQPHALLEVPDARLDERFSGNPLVTADPHVIFYAGAPLLSPAGLALGTLCLIDYKPRELTDAQQHQLRSLAERASALLGARQHAGSSQDALEPPGATGLTQAAVAAQSLDNAAPLRVLVVDDEEGLCRIACKWLNSLGAQASSCTSAEEALELLATDSFDLLFSDILMPGEMDGVALARAALERFPDLKVVLTTGFAPSVSDQEDLPASVMKKPYRREDVAQMLQQVKSELASRSGAAR